MTQYRLNPASDVGYWSLYKWIDYTSLFGRKAGYWTYLKTVHENEVPSLKAHLSKPEQYFEA